jgi:glycosyltransferase involved in cell wall biosynthesis
LSRRWPDEWKRQTARLHSYIERDGLKEVVHLVDGYLSRDELIKYTMAGDIVCLPFEMVPSDVPLSVLEAMALGRGVITTRIACIPELVSDERGFLVPPASANALGQQLQLILQNPSLAGERGRRAKAYVRECRTHTSMGEELQSVLQVAQSMRLDRTRQVT